MRTIFSIVLALVFYSATAQTNITKMEYWIDSDPGIGNAANIPVTASPDVQINQFSIPMTTAGVHIIGIRCRDAKRQWSHTNFYPVLVVNPPANSKIQKAEYWIDTDPGLGNATNIPVTASTDVQVNQFPVSLKGLAGGVHTVGIRSMDKQGQWSHTNFYPVLVFDSPSSPITTVEYFWDTDPGFGNAMDSVLSVPAQDISNGKFLLKVPSNLTTGIHTLFVRSRDSRNQWSHTNYALNINVKLCTDFQVSTSNDTAVCKGLSANLSVKNSDWITYTWSPAAGLSTTTEKSVVAQPDHSTTYTVTAKNGSCIKTKPVVVNVNPLPADSSGVDKSICQGDNASIGGLANAGRTYSWSPKSGINNSSVSNPLASPSVSTTYTLTEKITSTGCSSSNTTVVTVNDLPAAPAISQSGNVLSSTAANGNQWYKDGNIISGATNQDYTPDKNGKYSVIVTDGNKCSSPESNKIDFVFTSTHDVPAHSLIRIYPSPTSGKVIVDVNGSEKVESLVVYDNIGRQLLKFGNLKTTGNPVQIDLSPFSNGIYNILINDESGIIIYNQKVIKSE